MKAARRFLKLLDSFLDLSVALALLLIGAYAAYALWDNNEIYRAAENVQAVLLTLKPSVSSDNESGDSFDRLCRINPDVRAWLTLDNTKIDYPVLQGTDNLCYINTDVYGNFALAGSLFLDSRNDGGFGDAYSLLYGHHMENRKMFGDLDLYKDEKFFADNSSGTLFLPDRAYDLEIFACLLVPASEETIFDPSRWKTNPVNEEGGLVDFVEKHFLQLRFDVLDEIRASEKPWQILAMSTCSSEFTDARTVVLAVMKPYLAEA